MVYRITQMKISRFRADYNNHFEIWSKMKDGKIRNQELTDYKIHGLFTVIDSIVLLIPTTTKYIDSDIIDIVNSNSENKRIKKNYTEIFDDLEFHSTELHKLGKSCDIGLNMHFYNFNEYSEIEDFVESLNNFDVEVQIYTTLMKEREEPVIIVQNNDNSNHEDNSTNINIEGDGNKVYKDSKVKEGKGFWDKLVAWIMRIFGAS